eukprot:569580-Hanusia_phi.AAC.1
MILSDQLSLTRRVRFDPNYDVRESAGYRDVCVCVEVGEQEKRRRRMSPGSADGLDCSRLSQGPGSRAALQVEGDERADSAYLRDSGGGGGGGDDNKLKVSEGDHGGDV